MALSVGVRLAVAALVAGYGELIPKGTRAEIFRQIFWVFLVLGTLVGVVVVGYMLYTAYKYRDDETESGREVERDTPRVGELPTGTGGGRKLFFSFGLSTIIVVSLIIWTYGTLLYVEGDSPAESEDALEVEVVGFRFGWEFVYPNGHETRGELRMPADEAVRLNITSDDVFHTFGVSELRVKTDAIPGQRTDTWVIANETGTYEARCYELCGAGHSYMTADVVVMEPSAFDEWYANTTNGSDGDENASALSPGVVG